ncbi:MAG: hypothetical protein VX077_00875, partial [Pseudomonadota bacterium]|nr:hypothetical protein [Pseudomonadota bacterium]
AALTILAALLVLPSLGVNFPTPTATLCLVAVFAVTGFVDDHLPLPSAAKLVLQAIGIGLFWLLQSAGNLFSGLPVLSGLSVLSGLALVGVLALVLVQLWWVNLFNFMDGADGLAPGQVVLGAFGLGLCLFLLPKTAPLSGDGAFALLALVLGAALGLLVFTRPRARMFMGDCGALVLAALVLVLAVEMTRLGYALAQVSVFFSLFIADATLTLVGRAMSGQNPFQPHRDHGYQRFILHTQAQGLRMGLKPDAARTRAHRRALLWLIVLNGALVIPLGLLAIAVDHSSAAIAVHVLAFVGAGIVRFGFQPAR